MIINSEQRTVFRKSTYQQHFSERKNPNFFTGALNLGFLSSIYVWFVTLRTIKDSLISCLQVIWRAAVPTELLNQAFEMEKQSKAN